jgi:phenylalanyl-tRNA synthetase beta subunit
VELIDEFMHPKTGRASKCFRVNYRSMERSLTNEEVDVLQVGQMGSPKRGQGAGTAAGRQRWTC